MWKLRKEEESAASVPAVPNPKEVHFVETPRTSNEYRAEVATIGKSVLVKGELSGSEDLYLDGEVEGSIDLRGHSLTIGPNGRVRAEMRARDVVIFGKVDGNVSADRVELKKSAIHIGNIVTQRIVIEDGAHFKGSVDIQREPKPEVKPEPKSEVKPEPKTEAKAEAAPESKPESKQAVAAVSGGSPAQPSLLDPKR